MILATSTILILTILLSLLYLYFKRIGNYFENRNVPTIPANPIFGHLKDLILMKKSPSEIAMELYNHPKLKDKPFGGIFVFQNPGIVVRDIELIKSIFIKDFNLFTDHYGHVDFRNDVVGRNNLFFSKGSKWRAMRQKMLLAFTSGKMKLMYPLFEKVSNFLSAKIRITLQVNGNSCFVNSLQNYLKYRRFI